MCLVARCSRLTILGLSRGMVCLMCPVAALVGPQLLAGLHPMESMKR